MITRGVADILQYNTKMAPNLLMMCCDLVINSLSSSQLLWNMIIVDIELVGFLSVYYAHFSSNSDSHVKHNSKESESKV